MYESPAGLIAITENDLLSSGGFTRVEPEYLNITIGMHDASLFVSKGKDSGRFLSEIYWQNNITGREYTVEINANLNDPAMQAQKALLLDSLSATYGRSAAGPAR